MYAHPDSNQKQKQSQNQQTSNLGYRKSIMNSTNTPTGKIQAQSGCSAHSNGVLLHLSDADNDLMLELLEQVHERLESFQGQIRQVQQMLSQMIRFFVATVLCLLILIGSLYTADTTQSPAAMSSLPSIELGGRHAGF